jgi:tRNA (cmo5U34)-methyltransferase
MRDQVYAGATDSAAPFEFTEEVAAVFPDMIARSVPGYAATLKLIRSIADRTVTPGSRIYDLGCSLGSASLQIVDQIGDRAEIIAVDNSDAMIQHLTAALSDQHISQIHPLLGDIRDTEITDAKLTLLNFTLQFIPIADRLPLLTKIAAGTQPGGVLVLSEKIQFDDPAVQQELTALHEAFKKANGYSELEISRKRTALENVLIPETLATHRERLHAAGFTRSQVWFQCFNFASLLAFRD